MQGVSMHTQQSAARQEEAHGAVDKVFHNIKEKISLLEEKRRRQGELFVKASVVSGARHGHQPARSALRRPLLRSNNRGLWF